MKYVAVMFDVIESRKYYDRYDVQNILMESVNYLNDLYNCKIKKRVVSSAGDEFQGLFMDLQSAYIYTKTADGDLSYKSKVWSRLWRDKI